jgi:hypothetical protein
MTARDVFIGRQDKTKKLLLLELFSARWQVCVSILRAVCAAPWGKSFLRRFFSKKRLLA